MVPRVWYAVWLFGAKRKAIVDTGDCSQVGANWRTRLDDATFYSGAVSLSGVMVWFVTLTDPVLAALLRSAGACLAR